MDIDSFLDKEQKARCTAFVALVESKLGFAMDYELWYELSNFNEITARNEYPWPLNYFIPRMERHKKINEMLAKTSVLSTSKVSGTN